MSRAFMHADELAPLTTEYARNKPNMNVNQPRSNRERTRDVYNDRLAVCLRLAFLHHCFSRPAISL